jgi:hypothetical protein
MRNFASVCKKKLKETLTPYGYKSWKRAFLKMEKDVFFLIDMRGHYSFYGSGISTIIGVEPYCSNILLDESELREPVDRDGGNLFHLLNKIDPERFTMEYVRLLTLAQDDEGMLKRLDIICDILKEYVMPYMENYKDLEFYYNERFAIYNSPRSTISPYATKGMFGMSIKLKKYENAIHYPNHMMPLLSERIYHEEDYVNNMISGNWSGALQLDESPINIEPEIMNKLREKQLKKLLRKIKENPNFVDEVVRSAREGIAKEKEEFNQLKSIKDAVESKDYGYLDRYIEGVEERSRAHHEGLLRGK